MTNSSQSLPTIPVAQLDTFEETTPWQVAKGNHYAQAPSGVQSYAKTLAISTKNVFFLFAAER